MKPLNYWNHVIGLAVLLCPDKAPYLNKYQSTIIFYIKHNVIIYLLV